MSYLFTFPDGIFIAFNIYVVYIQTCMDGVEIVNHLPGRCSLNVKKHFT